MRGVDQDGHVANYIETEQIIFYRQYKASFVQVINNIVFHLSSVMVPSLCFSFQDKRFHPPALVTEADIEIQAKTAHKHCCQSGGD